MSNVKGYRNTLRKIDSIPMLYIKALKESLLKNSVLLTTHTKKEYLTGGTTATKLKRRSGGLIGSTKPIRPKLVKEGIRAGIQFGKRYAKSHIIGKDRKRKMVINAKPGKFLAIPLDEAKTPAGVPRGRPRDKTVFGNTFIIPVKSVKGKVLIIYGERVYQKGVRTGETKGKLVPLFRLVKQVTIDKRIDPMFLLWYIKPRIIKDIKNIKVGKNG